MELLGLPDRVLLRVLRLLDVRSLLRCRLLCRRLSRLALHANAWRHLCVASDYGPLRVLLRLVPRVGKIRINVFAGAGPRCITEIREVSETPCAAEELHIQFYSHPVYLKEEVALLVMSAVRNQAALGRLQKLRVASGPSHLEDPIMRMRLFERPIDDTARVDLPETIVSTSEHARNLELDLLPDYDDFGYYDFDYFNEISSPEFALMASFEGPIDDKACVDLLKTIVTTSGIVQELELDLPLDRDYDEEVSSLEVAASLTSLVSHCYGGMNASLLLKLLSTHSATLEQVHLFGGVRDGCQWPVRLRTPRLQELRCNPVFGGADSLLVKFCDDFLYIKHK
ncbi:uncharacterized protein LOC113213718 [Frankliniella occidentalis]|uniref:Uncharacterized protein LOC113213718 n=1 Tax=Frankliniella occidentalis TaxID=133901 RepID=A0A9C6U4D7_FRAOC|nr:uncharacterized protein LOC113213718 [Frankliniella occidentalis]